MQVVSQYSSQLAPIAVDAVMKVVDPAKDTNVNLKDIRIVKKLGYVKCVSVKLSSTLLQLQE